MLNSPSISIVSSNPVKVAVPADRLLEPHGAMLVHHRQELDALITRQAGLMNTRYADARVLVMPVMTGALVYAGQLLPQLRFELELDYVHASRYDGSHEGGVLQWRVRPRLPVAGRSVLLLDDILDEGLTLQGIRDWLLAEGAADVAIAVLLHKQKSFAQPCALAFPALPVPDRYVYGFGLDQGGLWRNADGIFVASP